FVYDNLDNRLRPTRGETFTISADVAGLGGSERYAKLRFNAAKYWQVAPGWIFSLSGEGGYVKGLGQEVRLTDRFFLGDPQMRGFDIRGVGPRIVREYYTVDDDGLPVCADGTSAESCTNNGGYTFNTDSSSDVDDPLGGNAYYLTRAELEIPLGTGAREMGLRPSIFLDAGAVFDLKAPTLTDTGYSYFVASHDDDGNALYTQIDQASIVDGVCTAESTSTVTNSINPNPPTCLDTAENTALGSSYSGFREVYMGNSPLPRISVGIGVNWNSPFGPFRIDLSKVLWKQPGDDTKSITFNIGTQF
ncbi:MAG TPA: BamA/TamA family outer membrane protein, partial [Sphingomonadaceae bacterium]|nr:BamA/TamA family outer membrane protein [Sphingomonadaceae bacterium]